jgi:hypothetical protein
MKRMINAACRICKAFAKNQDLVTPGGTECFPENVRVFLEERFSDCTDLPTKTYKKIKSISVLKHDPEQQFRVQWFAMAFSSVILFMLYIRNSSSTIHVHVSLSCGCSSIVSACRLFFLPWSALIVCCFFRQRALSPATPLNAKITINGKNTSKILYPKMTSQTHWNKLFKQVRRGWGCSVVLSW